jgi:Bacterial membrane protein YfhO
MVRLREKPAVSARKATAVRHETTVRAIAEPRLAGLWASLVYAVCTMALAYPALGGQFLVNPRSDQFIAGYAFREFAASQLRSGHGFPQWSPYLFGGMPYVAAMHGDIFYPTFLLRMILPTDQAMTWGFAIHLFLAGLFTYGFLRAWGLGFFPSLLGGLAYMLSGQLASFASPGHDGKLFVSTLLPLALWMLVRGIRDGRAWAWGGLALTIGLAVLSPHPQLLQYMLLCTGAFALFVAFGRGEGREPLPRDVAMRRLGLALGAVVVGALIGAVQFLPVREYVPYSPRAGGRGYEYATSFSMPLEELIDTYLPQFSGILDRYWGRNGIHLHSEYLGAAVLVLAGAGLVNRARSGFRWFWVAAFVVSLLWALGGNTPFYHLVYAIVPGSKFFRAPSTMLFIVTFSTAMLAALGVERALARQVGTRYALGWAIAGAVVALLATSGALTNLAQGIAASSPYAGSQLDAMVASNADAVIGGAWRSFVFVLVACGVVWALAQNRVDARIAGWILVATVALDLFSIGRMYWMFSPSASQLYASDPAIDYVKRSEPGRVLALPIGPGAAGHDPFFDGDGLMVQRVRSVRGYHGNELGRYQRLAGKTAQSDYAPEIFMSPQFWRHENVRYFYTTAADTMISMLFEQLKLGQLPTKVVGPVRNAAGSLVYLYRLPGDNPPAWVAPLAVRAGDDAALATVLDPRFDPARVAIVDSAGPFGQAGVTALPAPIANTASITSYEPGRIQLKLSTPAVENTVLIVSENYFPGWTATADGKAAELTRADYNLIGVKLPAGAMSVDLSFRDAAFVRGARITIFALLVAVAGALAGVVIERRGRSPEVAHA